MPGPHCWDNHGFLCQGRGKLREDTQWGGRAVWSFQLRTIMLLLVSNGFHRNIFHGKKRSSMNPPLKQISLHFKMEDYVTPAVH